MNINNYINQHIEKGIINYCEAIIFPDGSIEDCIPSHQRKLISISKESYDELLKMIPIDASPNNWLICHNNVIALWYESCVYNTMTDKQKESLQLLIDNGILQDNYICYRTFEKQKCNLLNEFKRNNFNLSINEFKVKMDEINKKQKEIIIIERNKNK